MASEKQIEANRRNSKLSRGPSETGRLTSRLNATKHGMTAQLAEVEAGFSPEFDDRRAKWSVALQPADENGEWALDRVVASSFRIERCERSIEDLITDTKNRADLSWDQDRDVEAAEVFGRLARDPILASRQLQTTLGGVVLLIEAWFLLAGPLDSGKDWSDLECSKALDLLGIAADFRSGRMMIDGPEGSDSVAFRVALVTEEVERLEALRDEAMRPLEEMERRHAMAGDVALLSKRAQLLLRYERDAWKRYNQSMKELKGQTPPPPPVVQPPKAAPIPKVVQPAKATQRPIAPIKPTFEEQRRALQAEAASIVAPVKDELRAMGIVDEDAMIAELERRIGVTKRSQIGGVAIDRNVVG